MLSVTNKLPRYFKIWGGSELESIGADDDIVKQARDMNNSIDNEVDVLLIQSTNPQMLFPGLRRAERKGVPYFFCLRGAMGMNSVAQVIASYSRKGHAMGEWITRNFVRCGKRVERVRAV